MRLVDEVGIHQSQWNREGTAGLGSEASACDDDHFRRNGIYLGWFRHSSYHVEKTHGDEIGRANEKTLSYVKFAGAALHEC